MQNRKQRTLNNNPKFSARQWELAGAACFFEWKRNFSERVVRAETLASATIELLQDYLLNHGHYELASKLPDVLRNCDKLDFANSAEALAYASLHLVDRYLRVSRVLDHLMQIGRLPLRKRGVSILEVGAGPAPAIYAISDYYEVLKQWPESSSVSFGATYKIDTIDRGDAWDHILHNLSEKLIVLRRGLSGDTQLPFRRSIHNFSQFHTKKRHNEAIADRAQEIIHQFDNADEFISAASAYQYACEEGVNAPSAYDLIFLCNFLTQQEMTKIFQQELQDLTGSLTPGGVLVILGGTGGNYPALYQEIRNIAAKARLTEISPQEPIDPNLDQENLSIVEKHVRQNTQIALKSLDKTESKEICEKLPKDLIDESIKFKLPKFQALIFANLKPAR
jgi:hypothetical protein